MARPLPQPEITCSRGVYSQTSWGRCLFRSALPTGVKPSAPPSLLYLSTVAPALTICKRVAPGAYTAWSAAASDSKTVEPRAGFARVYNFGATLDKKLFRFLRPDPSSQA
eukprot:scaffold1233_cov395-Prasinococcus_capsulatus_cf.AAC.36